MIISQQPSFDIPKWVCWLAQDLDGTWWGYQVEPNLSHQSWYENEVGQCVRLGKTKARADWISSLKQLK